MINPENLSTDELYFSDEHYMSVSSWKKFNKCEVSAKENTPFTSTALLVGSYVDRFVEGTLDKFIAEHPEIISSRGETKGQLKADYKQADEICEYISKNSRLQQFLGGEKQTVMTGEISGVPFKIKIDSYSKGIAINDLKCMRSVTNSSGEYTDFITPWGYDIQMACYQEIVRQNTGEILPTFICAVTKETPINSVIVNIPQQFLDRSLYLVQSTIEHYYDVKTGNVEPVGCGTCSACISNRKDTPIISLADLLN